MAPFGLWENNGAMGTVCESFVNEAYCLTMRIYDCTNRGASFETLHGRVEVPDFSVKRWGE